MKIEQQAQTRAFLIQSFGSVRVGTYTALRSGLCRLFCDADNIRQAEQNRLYIYKKTRAIPAATAAVSIFSKSNPPKVVDPM